MTSSELPPDVAERLARAAEIPDTGGEHLVREFLECVRAVDGFCEDYLDGADTGLVLSMPASATSALLASVNALTGALAARVHVLHRVSFVSRGRGVSLAVLAYTLKLTILRTLGQQAGVATDEMPFDRYPGAMAEPARPQLPAGAAPRRAAHALLWLAQQFWSLDYRSLDLWLLVQALETAAAPLADEMESREDERLVEDLLLTTCELYEGLLYARMFAVHEPPRAVPQTVLERTRALLDRLSARDLTDLQTKRLTQGLLATFVFPGERYRFRRDRPVDAVSVASVLTHLRTTEELGVINHLAYTPASVLWNAELDPQHSALVALEYLDFYLQSRLRTSFVRDYVCSDPPPERLYPLAFRVVRVVNRLYLYVRGFLYPLDSDRYRLVAQILVLVVYHLGPVIEEVDLATHLLTDLGFSKEDLNVRHSRQ